jgi:hypothetical protein
VTCGSHLPEGLWTFSNRPHEPLARWHMPRLGHCHPHLHCTVFTHCICACTCNCHSTVIHIVFGGEIVTSRYFHRKAVLSTLDQLGKTKTHTHTRKPQSLTLFSFTCDMYLSRSGSEVMWRVSSLTAFNSWDLRGG